MSMKGVVLSGGSGSRLRPITNGISKQLLPVYDKPMIYYPLSVLMLAGIQDILLISTPRDLPIIENSLGDGSVFGINLSYAIQAEPKGIAEAYIIGEEFVGNDPSCLILGDNMFYGEGLGERVSSAAAVNEGCIVFGYQVSNPQDFGVIEVDKVTGEPVGIEEKPTHPKSDVAITGLYFYDSEVCSICKSLKPSKRGELEITDVNNAYLKEGKLKVETLGRGFAWLDSGTPDSLLSASQYVHSIQQRQGCYIACLEEIAFDNNWITAEQLLARASDLGNNGYARYLEKLVN